MRLDIEFVSGDRSTPSDIEKRIARLIPSARYVEYVGTTAHQYVSVAEREMQKPLLWKHNVMAEVPNA